MRFSIYRGSQKNMSQSVNTEIIEVVLGKIQLESASEIFDSSFNLILAQRSD